MKYYGKCNSFIDLLFSLQSGTQNCTKAAFVKEVINLSVIAIIRHRLKIESPGFTNMVIFFNVWQLFCLCVWFVCIGRNLTFVLAPIFRHNLAGDGVLRPTRMKM